MMKIKSGRLKRLNIFGILLFWVGLIGSGLAQTAYPVKRSTPANGLPAGLPDLQPPLTVSRASKLELSLMGGFAFYNSPSGSNFKYDKVFGGGVRVIFASNSILSVGASVGYENVLGSRTYENNIVGNPVIVIPDNEKIYEFLFSQKLHIGEKRNFHPYILGGLGLDLLDVGSFELHPTVQLGVGFEFPAGKDVSFFVEAKENFVLVFDIIGARDASFFYTPLNAGVAFDM